jgi:hypothetical protein
LAAVYAPFRQLACREGYCYQHVQAIIVSIDQYAETALSNRNYFLSRTGRVERRMFLRGTATGLF